MRTNGMGEHDAWVAHCQGLFRMSQLSRVSQVSHDSGKRGLRDSRPKNLMPSVSEVSQESGDSKPFASPPFRRTYRFVARTT